MLLIKTKSVGMWDVHCFHLVPKSPTLGPKPSNTSYATVGGTMTHLFALESDTRSKYHDFARGEFRSRKLTWLATARITNLYCLSQMPKFSVYN